MLPVPPAALFLLLFLKVSRARVHRAPPGVLGPPDPHIFPFFGNIYRGRAPGPPLPGALPLDPVSRGLCPLHPPYT